MAKHTSVAPSWRLTIPQHIYDRLRAHLFPGDGDEHGAVIIAGITTTARGVRLLAHTVHVAVDGVDYVDGKRGYRMLTADFIARHIDICCDKKLIYLAVHNHGGCDSVSFSDDDMRSHERGYPALLDIVSGLPVGALVFAKNAAAGDIWLPSGERVELESVDIVGTSLLRLRPRRYSNLTSVDARFDRQARLFGDAGQHLLSQSKVGIIGLGGAGSLLAEYLGRLGIGEFVLVDPDRVELLTCPDSSHLDDLMRYFLRC